MSDEKCAVVPLAEQLRSIPLDAVLRIDTPNALGCVDTRSIPVGRICHEAADALGVKGMEPWRLAVDTALVDSGLDCTAENDDPAARVRELLDWTRTIALDPAVSAEAQALIERGAAGVPASHAPSLDWIEQVRELLGEAYRFQSTSPKAQENINAALELIDSNAGVTACPESGKHCNVIGGECQTCGAVGMKDGDDGR